MSSPFTEATLDSSNYRPPPSPDHHPSVIVIVIISCGGVFLAVVVAAILSCLLKRRRTKKRTREEIDMLCADEHKKVKEEIVVGPYGTQAMVVTVEDEVHVDGQIIRKSNIEKLRDGSKGTLVTEPGQPSRA